MNNNKYYAKDLAIEITRRCNMNCQHCMRGDAQNIDIDHQHIRNLLRNFKSIHHLNITGGEPSLNCKAIQYILKQLRHFHIDVYRFDIVTNGSKTSMSNEFIGICTELYDYQEEEDAAMLDMSDDIYHDKRLHAQVVEKLSQYPFFEERGQSDYIYLFKEGRSQIGDENPIRPIYLNEYNYIYGDIYLNAEGMILSNGNLSYQRQNDNILCHSGNFRQYIKTTLRTE